MLKLGQQVRTYVMNPKSMPRIQLLGHIDIDTREWSDGVLTAASRAVVKESLGNARALVHQSDFMLFFIDRCAIVDRVRWRRGSRVGRIIEFGSRR